MSTNILKDAVPLHTYWENSTPPRIDLGKYKYGGLFIYMQVEDVKTFLILHALTANSFPVFFFQLSSDGYSLIVILHNE